MQNPSSKKPIIIVAIVLIVAGAAYFYFSGSPVDTTSSLSGDTPDNEASVEGAKVLNLLNQISMLKIDPAIFDAPVYRSLVDHTVTVVEQNVGKPNPFASFFGTTPPPAQTPAAKAPTVQVKKK